MANSNPHYLNLQSSYLFSDVNRRVTAFAAAHPDRKIIRLGIGDVTRPLVPAVVDALHKAVAEQATTQGFRGYGPEQGYPFLREAIVRDAYAGLGIDAGEVFVSDGAKCDLGAFPELFAPDARIAITDPVYPAYADVTVMDGRAGSMDGQGRFGGLIYLPCTAENGFVPDLPAERPDIIYLCFPNNPTGTVLTKAQLQLWVDYARAVDAVIFFDAAYEAFVREPGIPRSIYEVPGAHEVAVEFRSYSKTAGFTGLRAGFTVVPKTVTVAVPKGQRLPLHGLWSRRQSTKYNGLAYIVQRACEAVHTPEGRAQTAKAVDAYLANARCIAAGFSELGLTVAGGVNSPYVWVQLPGGMDSWEFFSLLLEQAALVGTPGAGFGPGGRGYFRLTGFGSPEDTREAVERLRTLRL